jgi:hypothetical protein
MVEAYSWKMAERASGWTPPACCVWVVWGGGGSTAGGVTFEGRACQWVHRLDLALHGWLCGGESWRWGSILQQHVAPTRTARAAAFSRCVANPQAPMLTPSPRCHLPLAPLRTRPPHARHRPSRASFVWRVKWAGLDVFIGYSILPLC